MRSLFHGVRFTVPPDSKERPYLWMGSLRNVWLSLPSVETRSDFMDITRRLCREFGGTLIEKYPIQWSENGKNFWWIKIAETRLLLMRNNSAGISAGGNPGDVELLIKIARHMGVEQFVGWRWILWRIGRGLFKSTSSAKC